MKTVSAKGDLAGIEREEFPKPKTSSKAADVAKLLDDPIAKLLGVSIARDSSGKVTGVSAQNLSGFPLADALGFQDGDVVQSVNGDRIDSPDRLSELYEKYKGTRTFQVGVVRKGHPITITVNVPDFLK
jgi:type II secretory pathway component PulC